MATVKLRGTRKQRVEKLAMEYLKAKAVMEKAKQALNEEVSANEILDCGTYEIRKTETTRSSFNKEMFINSYGEKIYEQFTKPSTFDRMTVKKKG